MEILRQDGRLNAQPAASDGRTQQAPRLFCGAAFLRKTVCRRTSFLRLTKSARHGQNIGEQQRDRRYRYRYAWIMF